MVVLFIVYVACLYFIHTGQSKMAFGLIVANIILSFFVFLYHAPGLSNIRL